MKVPDRRYSVPILSDSNVPRVMPGQMALADPAQSVQVDQEVLVIEPSECDGQLAGWFGRLVSRGVEEIVISQLNPPIKIAFKTAKVVAIHRVIGIFDAVVKL